MKNNKYSISIDYEACIGCGLCNETAPKIFATDEQMKSKILDNAEIDEELLFKAAEECASGAIIVIDNETGKKLWPKDD
ncbi:MAG: ferredoxin [Candidatus Paceibacterota bacterium]|jgi:ferredoxin